MVYTGWLHLMALVCDILVQLIRVTNDQKPQIFLAANNVVVTFTKMKCSKRSIKFITVGWSDPIIIPIIIPINKPIIFIDIGKVHTRTQILL